MEELELPQPRLACLILTDSGAPRLEPSTLPVGDATDMGYSQSKATLDLCVNILVRPTRISPRQSSGAAGP